MTVEAKLRIGRVLAAGFSVFLLTAETVVPDDFVMPVPMPGETRPVGTGDAQSGGLVCSDGMETNPFNDDLLVTQTAAEGCTARQIPLHT